MLDSLNLPSNFSWFDRAIVAVYLSGTLLVGLYVIQWFLRNEKESRGLIL